MLKVSSDEQYPLQISAMQVKDIPLIYFGISANLLCFVEGYNFIFIKTGIEIRNQHARNIEKRY